MKKYYLLLSIFLCSSLSAQEYLAELPTNPEANKCYAKCIVPDEYKDEIARVLVREAYDELEIVSAEYKTEYQDIVIRPASKRFVYKPAVYKTIMDTLWIKDPYHQLKVILVSFKNDFEKIEIKAKTGSWVAGDKDPDCPSINPADCRVFHYRESQALFREIPVAKVADNASTSSKRIDGNYTLITKQVEVNPAQTIQEDIPAKIKTIERRVLVKDETTRKATIPAEYKEIKKKILLKKGGMSAWREVPCSIPERGEILPINYSLGSLVVISVTMLIVKVCSLIEH